MNDPVNDMADAEARFRRAGELFQSGDLDGADAECGAVLAVIPDQPDTLHLRGMIAFQAGRPQDAAAYIRTAIEAAGDDYVLTYHLAEILRTQGELGEAEDLYRRALTAEPGNPDALFGLGNVLLQTGRAGEALPLFEEGLGRAPHDVLARCQLGEAQMELGDFAAAVTTFETALEAAPDSAEIEMALGMALKQTGEAAKATEHLEKALAMNPGLGAAAYHLGNLALEAGDLETATTRFGGALAADPDLADAHVGLGVIAQQQGRFDEAAQAHRAALAIRPNLSDAWYNLALSGEVMPGDDTNRIAALLDTVPPPPDHHAMTLGFALGKALADAGRHDEAFARIQAANDLKAATAPFDPAGYAAYVDDVLSTFDAAFFKGRTGNLERGGVDDETPVLIVGMPRSGTTLVEQIIAAHPMGAGAGELTTLTDIAGGFEADPGIAAFPGGARDLDEAQLKALAGRYLSALQVAAEDTAAARIADKMPNNYLRLGLVAAMLPKARVIHCRRDPRDTCLSAYFQNFTLDRDYTARLDWLGAYYRDYDRVMAHWKDALPLEMLEVTYEDLAANPEPGIRKIIEFCGLDWDDACLEFHTAGRRIRTFSFRDARKPAYTSSIGRWKAYEAHLGPLIDALGIDAPGDAAPS